MIQRNTLWEKGFFGPEFLEISTHVLKKTGYLSASFSLIQDDIRDEPVQLSASHNAVFGQVPVGHWPRIAGPAALAGSSSPLF